MDWDLAEVLAAEVLPDRADVVQPALWAVMVSLAAVWEAAGVTPDAVVGHSQGEIAAAVVAGVLSLEDGARVVALRSRALTALAGRGGMVSVAEPADAVRERIAAWGGRLSVAAVNGPAATVVSGEPDALAELVAACEADGVRARMLPVDYASHSAAGGADPGRDPDRAGRDRPGAGAGSDGLGDDRASGWTGPEAGAGYWYDSLRSPVEFDRAVAGAGRGRARGVRGGVAASGAGAGDRGRRWWSGTLRRDDGGAGRFLAVVGRGVRAGCAGGLGGGARRRAAGGPADLRVPAPAVLAAAGIGR